MKLRSFLFAILACASAGAADDFPMLVLDPLSARNACACVAGYAQRDYGALAGYLGEALKTPVCSQFGAVLAGQPAIVIGKQTEIERAAKTAGLKLTRVAALTDRKGSTEFHGLFVVRAKDPAKSLADLKGKRILFGPAGADEKHAAALAALKAAGVPLPEKIETRDTCNQSAADVAENKADVAVISSYAMPLLEGCGTIGKGELRIVGRTADVPFIALYVTSQFPAATLPELQKALEKVAADSRLLEQMESAKGFVVVKKKVADSAWTDWRGAERLSHSPFVPARLPQKPLVLWRAPLTSQALGGVAATESVVIVSDKNEETDIWRCFDAASGKQRWEFTYLAPGKMDFTSAPRATPVISGDDVFLFSAIGQLHCVGLRDGVLKWAHDLHLEYRGELPTWGYCATPLLVDDLVIVPGASKDAFLAAFDRRTGALRWKTPGNKPSYGNFLCAEFGKRRQIVGNDAEGAGGWDPKTGQRLWRIPAEFPAEFKVPAPMKFGERLLLAAEQSGARLHAFDANGCAIPKPVAQNPDANPDVTSPIEVDGMIWLTTDAGIYCLDSSLKIVWQLEEKPFTDPAQLIAGNGRVLVLTNKGTLALLPSRPVAATKPQLLPLVNDVEAWSQPALLRGRLYVRTDAELLCVALTE